MKINTLSLLKVMAIGLLTIFQLSCSKDSDLLSEYVLTDAMEGLEVRKFVVDDIFMVSDPGSVVLDVLLNDTFTEQEEVNIIDTSTPINGNVEINADDTLTYTPEAEEPITDTFTYTTEVVNADETVSTEQGTVTISSADRVNDGEIVLNTLKAFPSAFGAGVNITGGRGQSIYEVNNLNDSGSGSWRDAISRGNRLIIIKVEGRVDLESNINRFGVNNITVWGQFAPGRGLTISGGRHTFGQSHNQIIRHVTFQNKVTEGFGSFGIQKTEGGPYHGSVNGAYLDHLSTRYGKDQVLDLISRETQEKNTVAYCMIAEGLEGHNTGSITGNSGENSDAGQITWARNMYYNISHRFPNMGGAGGKFEVFNNYIVNWRQRLSAISDTSRPGQLQIDYFNNYAQQGNHNLGGANSVNKITYNASMYASNPPLFYSANNYIEAQTIRNPVPAPQKDIWTWRNNESTTFDGDNIVANETVDSPSLFATSKIHNFAAPSDGYWNVFDVPAKVRASVGHNRGINADGSPGFFRDNKDTDYINKAATGTTESTYRTSSQWDDASFTGTALYSDSDGDYMPDWFENQHAHLNPNDASDRDALHTSWIFENYTVTNNAKYTNLEICAEYYAGGFEAMIDGVNN